VERAGQLPILQPTVRERRAAVDAHIVQHRDTLLVAERHQRPSEECETLWLLGYLARLGDWVPVLSDSRLRCCRHAR